MSMFESIGQLSKAMKLLLMRWEQTQAAWDDPVSRRFEEQFLLPLQTDLRNAAGAMSEMSALLQQIQQDCADD